MAKKFIKPSSFDVNVKFLGLEANEAPPSLALYQMGPRGKAEKKLASLQGDCLTIPAIVQTTAMTVAIGPDVEDPQSIPVSSLQQYRSETAIFEWRKTELLEIPDIRWRPWLPFRTCVTGKAEKCWFELGAIPPIIRNPIPDLEDVIRLSPARQLALSPYLRVVCKPLCYGRVEVYRRVCCCDPWVIIPEIPNRIPELIPIPDPIPDPLPDPIIDFPPVRPIIPRRQQLRRIKKVEAELEPAKWQPLSDRVTNDLSTLYQMKDQQAQYDYLIDRSYLLPVLCRRYDCTTVKIGETTLGPDGSFSYCFPTFFTRINCTVTYTYKIKQWIGGQWVYVYDGPAAQAFFSGSELAELKTFNPRAEICDTPEPPVGNQGKPFVMLQAIGTTPSYLLHSPKQNSNTGINQALDAEDGLLDQSYASNCPMGGILDLLLYFDPDMYGVGARYYRFKLIEANNQGNPVGGSSGQILDSNVIWRKFIAGTYPPQPTGEALGPQTVSGTTGLFKIPYVTNADRWLNNQFHYKLDTRDFSNGRYLLKLELFDANGQQIKPQGVAGSGIDADFAFVWWKGEEETEIVAHDSLIHVLQMDNVKCFGDIIDLRQDSSANRADCQFMSGSAGSRFSTGFRAYHQNDFMLRYQLDYFRGLNGTDQILENGTNNRPVTKGAGLPAESAPATFGAMLGSTTVGAKCTFSLDLKVYAKHTNGRSRISGYDSFDEASFALEINE